MHFKIYNRMKAEQLLEKIEKIIEENELKLNSEANDISDKEKVKKNPFARVLLLVVSYFLEILRSPFKLVATYLKNELVGAVKKDMILYMLMGLLMGILFVFFSVIWLTISILIGVYYFDNGATIFNSILYSFGWQSSFFILISLIAFIAMQNMESMKMMKKIAKISKKQ